MYSRAASCAVSRIATPKKFASSPAFYNNLHEESGASPAFYICYQWRKRGKPRFSHLLSMEKAGQAVGDSSSRESGINIRKGTDSSLSNNPEDHNLFTATDNRSATSGQFTKFHHAAM
jgi:hypothetical protein